MTTLYLEQVNAHPKDERVRFQEEGHLYFIDGVSTDLVSVTTFIKSFCQPFDADSVISKMQASKSWGPTHRYFGKTPEDIKSIWEKERDDSSTKGTALHRSIELFYNNVPEPIDSIEYDYFIRFTKDHPELVPYRTEWIVYSEEHKVCGSIDMVLLNEDGTLSIRDWKRSKQIKKTNPFSRMKFPLDHLPDCNYYHYSLQLNLYKWILEKFYDKRIKDMELVVFHPTNDTYQCFRVPDMVDEIDTIMSLRKSLFLDNHLESETI